MTMNVGGKSPAWRAKFPPTMDAGTAQIHAAEQARDKAAADLQGFLWARPIDPVDVTASARKFKESAQLLMRLRLEHPSEANMDKVREVADAATKLLESASLDSGCKGPAFELFATEMALDQAEDESEVAPVTGTEPPLLDVHWQEVDMTGDIVATPVRRKPKRRQNDQPPGSPTQKSARTNASALTDRAVSPLALKVIGDFNSTKSVLNGIELLHQQALDKPTPDHIADFAMCGLAAICCLGTASERNNFTEKFIGQLVYAAKPLGRSRGAQILKNLIPKAPRMFVEALGSKKLETYRKELRLKRIVAKRLKETARRPGTRSDWREFLLDVAPNVAASLPPIVPVDDDAEHKYDPTSFLRLNQLSKQAKDFIGDLSAADQDFEADLGTICNPFDFNDREKHLTELLMLGSAAICRAESSKERKRLGESFIRQLRQMTCRRGLTDSISISRRWTKESKECIRTFFLSQAPQSVVEALPEKFANLGLLSVRDSRLMTPSLAGNIPADWLEFLKISCTEDAASFLATLTASDGPPTNDESDLPVFLDEEMLAAPIHYKHDDDLDVRHLLPDDMFENDVHAIVSAVQPPPVMTQTTRPQKNPRQLIPDAPPLDEHPQEAALRRLFTQDKPPGAK